MMSQFLNVDAEATPKVALRPVRRALVENAFIHESLHAGEVIHVIGEVDMATVDELEALIDNEAQKGAHVIVDLEPCRYIDSSTLTVLIRASDRYSGRFFIVVPPEGMVRRVFTITSLVDRLPIVASIDQVATH